MHSGQFKTPANPTGVVLVVGGILDMISDAVGGNMEACSKQQVDEVSD